MPTLKLTWFAPRQCWKKKIDGKVYYFKYPNTPQGLAAAQRELAQLLKDREEETKDIGDISHFPRAKIEPRNERSIVNKIRKFLDEKRIEVSAGQRAISTYSSLKQNLEIFLNFVGKPNASIDVIDFDLFNSYYAHLAARDCGSTTKDNILKSCQQFLRWATKEDEKFTPPKNIGKRFQREIEDGDYLFTPEEFRETLTRVNKKFRAIMLLGLNCGFTADDCTQLTVDKIKNGRLIHQRKKTKGRQAPKINYKLWQETLDALAELEPIDGKYFPKGKVEVIKENGDVKRFDPLCRQWNKWRYDKRIIDRPLKSFRKTGASNLEDKFPNCVLPYLADKLPGIKSHYVKKQNAKINPELDAATDYLRELFL